jgi:DNA primase
VTEGLDFNDRVLADIRAAADIVEVIGDHTTLKKAGRSWKGLCPFHREKTPSFTVDRDRGLFHCFGCGVGGDVFGFVRQMERLEFREAAELLARRFGVDVPRRSRTPRDDRRELLLAACAAAGRAYQEALWAGENPAAAYLRKRRVPEEAARELALGFAPDGWDFLASRLAAAHSVELLVEAGLLQPGVEGKRAYDRFRNRLIFPIRDDRGRVVAFGGRSLSGEEPKYLNSPETPLFAKGRSLYGLSGARESMRRRDRAILVEGYFDHLAFWLSDLREAVATMGTALAAPQAEKLRRIAPRVVVCYDGDSAGKTATRRALPILLSAGLEVSVAGLPAGMDPHDVLLETGPEAVTRSIERSQPFLDWLLEEDRPGEASTPEDRRTKTDAIVEILEAVPDRLLRYEYAKAVARRVQVPVEILWRKKGLSAPPPGLEGRDSPLPVLPSVPVSGLERRLLARLLLGAGGAAALASQVDPELLSEGPVRAIFEALRAAPGEDLSGVLGRVSEGEAAVLARIVLEEDSVGPVEDFEYIVRGLKKRFLDRKAEILQRAIGAAEEAGNREEIDRLYRCKLAVLKESQELSREGARRKSC